MCCSRGTELHVCELFLPGNSALHLAVRDNNHDFVEDLLSHGVYKYNGIKGTPLMKNRFLSGIARKGGGPCPNLLTLFSTMLLSLIF